jgi:hypothetical protein
VKPASILLSLVREAAQIELWSLAASQDLTIGA